MAATITMYDEFHLQLGLAAINVTTASRLRMVFLSTNTSIVQAAQTLTAALAGATESTGYTRPTLGSVTLTRDATNHRAILDAADVVVTDTGGFQAYRAILYFEQASPSDSTSIPIAHILLDDTAALQNPDTNGTLTVSWNATGILAI
jgi:hypothetical protein